MGASSAHHTPGRRSANSNGFGPAARPRTAGHPPAPVKAPRIPTGASSRAQDMGSPRNQQGPTAAAAQTTGGTMNASAVAPRCACRHRNQATLALAPHDHRATTA